MTRRQFAKSLGAAAVLLPFLPRRAWAAAPARRVIIVTSLATNNALWRPASAPGQPPQLPQMLQGLQPVLDHIVLADGLSFARPTEGHSSPQTLTGRTFGDAFDSPTCDSIDQFIASSLGSVTKLPKLLLGWKANSESQFWAAGARVPPIDAPLNAWQTAFGGATSTPTTATGPGLPRRSILDLVKGQIAELSGQLGVDAQRRLDDHLDSIRQLEQSMSGGGKCAAGAPPDLGGADPENDASTAAVADAHLATMVAALQCDVTRVVGMQWGVSDRQYLGVPGVMLEEHSMVHSGDDGVPRLLAAETYLCGWFTKLVTTLAQTPDPTAPGSSLLDNTLILWTRDQADAPNHKQYSMPYVLAGGKGYLRTQAGGLYVTYGGNDAANVSGVPHQRLLLNLAEYMGATGFTAFGNVAKLASGDQQPLSDIKV
ncbi:MAG TPA: DUF1552 domain-containing protein [Myxococcota bacterium]|nr:DUF1552 domain-containing protein [Myxococcota bacterium]